LKDVDESDTPVVNFINILQQLLRQYSFAKKLQSHTVIKGELRKALSFEKGRVKC
jgi:hypothetical protein